MVLSWAIANGAVQTCHMHTSLANTDMYKRQWSLYSHVHMFINGMTRVANGAHFANGYTRAANGQIELGNVAAA